MSGNGESAAGPPVDGALLQINRERLLDGSLLMAFRAGVPAGTRVRTDAELDESLAQALAGHDWRQDLYLFGYGSLMWNPAFDHEGQSRALVRGWRRSFCLRSVFGRGSAADPGLMLALDRGGACNGAAFRIAPAKAEQELRLVWRREMLSGVYDARWLAAAIDGRPVRVLTFVANRRHERYLGRIDVGEAARLIATGRGRLGTCRAYFDSMIEAMQRMGIRDAAMERLRRELPAGTGPGG
ncbi:MAG: gamma-glutamylcyclotransferase [Burkholderiaceae bacterium]